MKDYYLPRFGLEWRREMTKLTKSKLLEVLDNLEYKGSKSDIITQIRAKMITECFNEKYEIGDEMKLDSEGIKILMPILEHTYKVLEKAKISKSGEFSSVLMCDKDMNIEENVLVNTSML